MPVPSFGRSMSLVIAAIATVNASACAAGGGYASFGATPPYHARYYYPPSTDLRIGIHEHQHHYLRYGDDWQRNRVWRERNALDVKPQYVIPHIRDDAPHLRGRLNRKDLGSKGERSKRGEGGQRRDGDWRRY